jgi:hypothetical protein
MHMASNRGSRFTSPDVKSQVRNAMVVDDYWTQILLDEVHTPWQCTIGVPKALILCIHDMDNSFLGCWYVTPFYV